MLAGRMVDVIAKRGYTNGMNEGGIKEEMA
jgi:hypothetical protein